MKSKYVSKYLLKQCTSITNYEKDKLTQWQIKIKNEYKMNIT